MPLGTPSRRDAERLGLCSVAVVPSSVRRALEKLGGSLSGTAAGGGMGDLRLLQPSDLDSFELPIIKRRKLEACIDGLKGKYL